MRKSRVLLAGVAVAAAAAATSAFTAGNTMPANSVLGYGEVQVTGINVTGVKYNRLASDNGVLDNVEFSTDHATDLTGVVATMTLRDTVLPGTSTTNHTCSLSGTAPAQKYTCEGDGVLMATFDTVGLTVGGA